MRHKHLPVSDDGNLTRRDGAGAGAGGAALPGAGLSALHSLPRPHLPLPRHQVDNTSIYLSTMSSHIYDIY